MERNVWIFWEGKEISLLKILYNFMKIKSFSSKGYKLNLINHSNMFKYIDIIPDCFFQLGFAHQADFIRMSVLKDYGGIYLDYDTLVIEPLDSIFSLLEKYECVFVKQNNEKICNGFLSCRKGSNIMNKWYEQMMNVLKIYGSAISWEAIGNDIINPLYESYENKNDILLLNGLDTIYPINWDKPYELLRPIEDGKLFEREFQPCLILFGEIYRHLSKLSCQGIWNSSYVLNHFLEKANNGLISYDFIEIGTSDFDTCIQTAKDTDIGLSIEPLSCYLNKLPNKKNVKKIQSAITFNKTADFIEIYYISPETIKKYKLPDWMRGCNCIGHYHPLHIKHNVQKLVTIEKVSLKNVEEIMIENQVGEIKYLKIDTEGEDITILNGFIEWLWTRPKIHWPKKILFESNERADPSELSQVLDTMTTTFGYKIEYSNHDTLLILQ